MKLLRIDDLKGHFLKDDGDFAAIDRISKEDLLRLVDLTLSEDDIEYDEYSDEAINMTALFFVPAGPGAIGNRVPPWARLALRASKPSV